jgi:hypothetical protein
MKEKKRKKREKKEKEKRKKKKIEENTYVVLVIKLFLYHTRYIAFRNSNIKLISNINNNFLSLIN